MLCLSKVMLHPCLVIFVHRVAMAALLSRPKFIEIPISPFVISFRTFYKSNMLVCLSTSLLDVSITFVCLDTFLQSLENVRARQLGATINTTYCLFCFIDSTKIQQKYYNPTGVSLVLNIHLRNSTLMEIRLWFLIIGICISVIICSYKHVEFYILFYF